MMADRYYMKGVCEPRVGDRVFVRIVKTMRPARVTYVGQHFDQIDLVVPDTGAKMTVGWDGLRFERGDDHAAGTQVDSGP